MNTKNKSEYKLHKSIFHVSIVTGIILLFPLIMTIHDGGVEGVGWNWTLGDFITMGFLLFIAGLAIDFIWRKVTKPLYRVTAIVAIVTSFLLIWVELAVNGITKALAFFI